MPTDGMCEHLGPGLVLAVAVAQTEHDEGEPAEEEQAVEQGTAGQTACDAEQRTVGADGCQQDADEHDGVDGSKAIEARLAESLAQREQTLLYHALHHQATEGKGHEAAVQTVARVAEEPAQAFVVEKAAARHTQRRQHPREERQQGRHDKQADKVALVTVHRLRGCRGRGCAAGWHGPRGERHSRRSVPVRRTDGW